MHGSHTNSGGRLASAPTEADGDDSDPELAFEDVECGCRVALVDTAGKLENAVELLMVSGEPVAVDIEGANLGARGQMATVQLCVEGSNDVFICDIVALGEKAFSTKRASLRVLLESADIMKLFWDCRTDAKAL